MRGFVQRSFHCETKEEREEWIAAYNSVKAKVEKPPEPAGGMDELESRTRAMSFMESTPKVRNEPFSQQFPLINLLGPAHSA